MKKYKEILICIAIFILGFSIGNYHGKQVVYKYILQEFEEHDQWRDSVDMKRNEIKKLKK